MKPRPVTVLALSGAILLFSLQPAVAAASDDRWHVGPRAGFSYATGHFGVEAQRGHFGVAAGATLGGRLTTTALKYYLNETDRSWSIGVGYSWGNVNEWNGNETDRLLGIGVEHRWRFGSGWEFAAGSAIARARWGEDDTETLFIPSLSWGYSFSFLNK